MICDGDSLPDNGITEAEIIIVGAGPIGVALATRLSGRVGRIVLVEAGGSKFKSSQNLTFFKAAQVDDTRHAPTELYRRRMLGGTTSVWGGRCIPFYPEDFAPANGRAGWPIPFAEFDARVAEALEFLDAGKPEFSAAAAMPKSTISVHQADSGIDFDHIERYSKPTNLWRKLGTTLAKAREVMVIYGAMCTSVLTNSAGTHASAIELRTVSNRRHKVVAPTIVLACGGLETPRLLLASRRSRSCGLGNEHDLVGRFYMTHLVSSAQNVGSLRFANADNARAFDFNWTVDGVYGRRLMLLSLAERQQRGIPHIAFRLTRPPMEDASHRDAVLSAMFLVRNLLIPPEYARSLIAKLSNRFPRKTWREHGANVLSDIPKLCGFSFDWLRRRVLARRKLPSVFLYRADGTYPLEFNAEQMPNADSRVMLGDEVDPFGIPRLAVRWRFRDAELDSICEAYRMLATAIAKSGLGEVQLDPDLRRSVESALVPQGGHHIGTVRMSADNLTGVVNTNGEVWGTRGLFVAGTSILPTSGFANPTLTAVALAFRLAEHLAVRQNATSIAPSTVPRTASYETEKSV